MTVVPEEMDVTQVTRSDPKRQPTSTPNAWDTSPSQRRSPTPGCHSESATYPLDAVHRARNDQGIVCRESGMEDSLQGELDGG